MFDDIESYPSEAGIYLDVPFVPTDEQVVDAMLELANVGPKDILYDLGSGDGRIVIAAAKEWGTRGVGIDIDPLRIADAMEFAGWAQVEGYVDFIEDDILTADFREATVITLYLLQSINMELRPRFLSELRPGTRIVSHAFDMGDWKADDQLKVGGITIYKWIVPAKVAGVWEWRRFENDYRIDLRQSFQEVSGTAWVNGSQARLAHAELHGRQLKIEIREDDTNRLHGFTLDFADQGLRVIAAGTP